MDTGFRSANGLRSQQKGPALAIASSWLRLVFMLSLMMAVGWPSEGNAQVSAADKVAAEMLFDRGLRLMQEGEFHEACSELERSQAIEAGIGTMLYLADCYERIGRTASAWAMFREAASTAKAKEQLDRAEVGAERAKQLEPRLTSLSIHVARPVPGISVFRNGQLLPASLYGIAVPVDPGEQRIEARAKDYVPFATTVTLQGDGKHLNVDLPQLRAKPKSEPLAVGSATHPEAESLAAGAGAHPLPLNAHPSARPAGADSDPMWHETLALTLGAIGLVGVGTGTYFGARAIWKNNAAEEQCPDRLCQSDKAIAFDDAARSAARLSTLCWIGGAAFLLGGVAIYLIDSEGQPRSVALRPRPDGLELSLGGVL